MLLDVQSGLLASLPTRVVVPLCLASTIVGDRIQTLMNVTLVTNNASEFSRVDGLRLENWVS